MQRMQVYRIDGVKYVKVSEVRSWLAACAAEVNGRAGRVVSALLTAFIRVTD